MAQPGPDPRDAAWVGDLLGGGEAHDRAVADLHALLLRVARHEVNRRARAVRIGGPEVDDLAHQAAADALMAIRAKVGQFRGESRFTTWAYRFVGLEVSAKIGRHFWVQHRSELDEAGWARLPDTTTLLPHQAAEGRELGEVVRRLVDDELTDLQRTVFVAVAVHGIPMDALAAQLGSTRNALYKVLFDARRKLRTGLAERGFGHPSRSVERA